MTKDKIEFIIACFVALLVTTTSCSSDNFEMETSFIKSGTFAGYTDQLPIELSTFRLDSVQTSGQNISWVGKATKPLIGDIHSEAYVRLSEPSSYTWGTQGKEVYDSITMVLIHTGAYEGDTTKTFSIDVRRLATTLQFAEDESAFYNQRTFRDSTSIGRFSFKPRPHTRPRVRFRLDDSFGQELVQFIKDMNTKESVERKQRFINKLGGIKLTCTEGSDPQALLAFRSDSIHIVLHSHWRGLVDIQNRRTLKLSSEYASLQYNNVWNENVSSPFDELDLRPKQVVESKTNYKSLIYEGLGYYTRINFPNLNELETSGEVFHVVKATLKLYPLTSSYDKRTIPSRFYLFTLNKGNVPQNYIRNGSGAQVTGQLHFNYFDRQESYYEADLTYYINTVLSQDYIDPDEGLLLTWGNGMSPTNYDFLIFNGHGYKDLRYKSKLEIYFYNYDRE